MPNIVLIPTLATSLYRWKLFLTFKLRKFRQNVKRHRKKMKIEFSKICPAPGPKTLATPLCYSPLLGHFADKGVSCQWTKFDLVYVFSDVEISRPDLPNLLTSFQWEQAVRPKAIRSKTIRPKGLSGWNYILLFKVKNTYCYFKLQTHLSAFFLLLNKSCYITKLILW